MASKKGIEAGRAYVRAYWDDTAVTRGLKQLRRSIGEAGKNLKSLGTRLLGLGTLAGTPLSLAVRSFAGFDDAIRAVQAVTGATAEEFERLRTRAKELGRTTSFTAAEVANLMTELGRAGFRPTQIEEMTAAVLNLSRATGTEAAQSAGIMAASLRQFNMPAEDAVRVADALTAAANKSYNTLESLGESLSYAGPVAADMNMSIEETLAILGALGNVGIQGSNAGTAIRRLLTLNAAEAEKFQRIFGVSTLDAAGNARPLVDVLAEINEATADLGSGERAAKFNEAFGLLGITGASAIAKNAVSAKQLLEDIRAATGIASDTAQQMDAGIGGAWRRLLSAVEGTGNALAETLAPTLSRIADWLGVLNAKITSWIERNQQLAAGLALVVPGVIGLGAALLVLGVALNGLAAGLTLTIALWGALTSPIGLVSAAVVGLGYVLLRHTEAGRAAIDALRSTFGPLAAQAMAAFAAIKNALAAGEFGAAAQVAMASVRVAIAGAVDWIESKWLDVKEGFLEAVDGIRIAWADLITWLVRTLADGTAKLLEISSSFVEKLVEAVEGVPGLNRLPGLDAARSGAMSADRFAGIARSLGAGYRAGPGELLSGGSRAPRGRRLEEAMASLSQAMEEARRVTEAATAARAAEAVDAGIAAHDDPARPAGQFGVPVAAARVAAVNAALRADSREGISEVMRLLTGVRRDGAEAAIKQGNKISTEMLRELREQRRRGVAIARGDAP